MYIYKDKFDRSKNFSKITKSIYVINRTNSKLRSTLFKYFAKDDPKKFDLS